MSECLSVSNTPVTLHLLSILSPGGIKTLYQGGGVSQEHGVTGGSSHHAEYGQPEVCQVLRGKPAVTDTQHVGHRLEQGPGVLLEPPHILDKVIQMIRFDITMETFSSLMPTQESWGKPWSMGTRNWRHPDQ